MGSALSSVKSALNPLSCIANSVSSVGNNVERAAGNAVQELGEVARDLGNKAERVATNLGHQAELAADKAVHEAGMAARDLGNKAERAADNLGHQAERAADNLGHQAERVADNLGNKAERVADNLGKQVDETIDKSTRRLSDNMFACLTILVLGVILWQFLQDPVSMSPISDSKVHPPLPNGISNSREYLDPPMRQRAAGRMALMTGHLDPPSSQDDGNENVVGQPLPSIFSGRWPAPEPAPEPAPAPTDSQIKTHGHGLGQVGRWAKFFVALGILLGIVKYIFHMVKQREHEQAEADRRKQAAHEAKAAADAAKAQAEAQRRSEERKREREEVEQQRTEAAKRQRLQQDAKEQAQRQRRQVEEGAQRRRTQEDSEAQLRKVGFEKVADLVFHAAWATANNHGRYRADSQKNWDEFQGLHILMRGKLSSCQRLQQFADEVKWMAIDYGWYCNDHLHNINKGRNASDSHKRYEGHRDAAQGLLKDDDLFWPMEEMIRETCWVYAHCRRWKSPHSDAKAQAAKQNFNDQLQKRQAQRRWPLYP